jgi:hypothetical protein
MGRPRRWQGPNRTRLKQLQGRANRVRQPCPAGMEERMDLTEDLQIFPKKPQLGTDFDDVYHWLCGVDVVG